MTETDLRMPLCVRDAVSNRRRLGPAAAAQYFVECMDQRQRKSVDIWLMRTGHPLVHKPCPQQRRFEQLVEEIYAQEEAAKEEA